MEGDPTTIGTVVGAIIGGVATGVLGALGLIRKGRGKSVRSSNDTAVEKRVQEERAEEGRLARIEEKVDRVLSGQAQHAADDERRFAEHAKELQQTRHNLHDRIAALPTIQYRVDRLEDDLKVTRRQLDLDTEVIRIPRRERDE